VVISEFQLPTKIISGNNCIDEITHEIQKFGTKILLVTSKDIFHLEKKLFKIFNSNQLTVFTTYLESGEPTVQFINSCKKQLSSENFDCIVGLGGGSAIDTSKALSIALSNSESIWMYANRANFSPLPLTKPLIPILAIPTTSGSGSEVTPYSVIKNLENNQKSAIYRDEIIPKVAFLDPTLLSDMPLKLTSSTAFDTLAHDIESFLNISKFSPLSDFTACESIRLIFNSLPKIINDPTDLDSRMKMAWASTLGGIAISNRGTTTAHAIAEAIGGITNLPHGLCVAISTIPVLKKTLEKSTIKLSELYDQIHVSNNTPDHNKAKFLVDEIDNLSKLAKLDLTLSEICDVSEELIDEIFEHVYTYKFRALDTHCVQFSKEEISEIIKSIIVK